MLRWDVVHAAKSGQFHIYAVETVDDAIHLLTGMDAGDKNEKGEYALSSFNGKVDTQLKSFNQVKQAFMQTNK